MVGERTKLGDTLRLQYEKRVFRCEVHGPSEETGRYWLKFFLSPNEQDAPVFITAAEGIFREIWADLEARGVRVKSMSAGFDAKVNHSVIHANFDPRSLMAAYQVQLSFGQQGPQRSR